MKDFTLYNYGCFSSKTKDEVYWVLNKCKVNSLKKYVISKYHKQNKSTSMWGSIKRSEPVKWSEIDVKEDTINHYKPEEINSVFDDKCTEYKSKRDKNTSLEQCLEKIRPYLGDVKNKFKKSGKWKITLRIDVNFKSSKDNDDKQLMYSKSSYRNHDWQQNRQDY